MSRIKLASGEEDQGLARRISSQSRLKSEVSTPNQHTYANLLEQIDVLVFNCDKKKERTLPGCQNRSTSAFRRSGRTG